MHKRCYGPLAAGRKSVINVIMTALWKEGMNIQTGSAALDCGASFFAGQVRKFCPERSRDGPSNHSHLGAGQDWDRALDRQGEAMTKALTQQGEVLAELLRRPA